MSLSPRLVRLRGGLAARRGVLILGPDLAHGQGGVDIDLLLEERRDDLDDASGWDNLGLDDRLTLATQSLGPAAIDRLLGQQLPSVEVLDRALRAFHHQLVGLPFPLVIDTGLHDLVEATLRAGGHPVRVLTADADLVQRAVPLPGERTLVKLRGDLLLGEVALTPARLAEVPRTQPLLWAMVQAAVQQGPVMLYGFTPRDPVLRWFVDAVAPVSGTAVLAMRSHNRLWRQHWTDRGFEVIAAADVPTLEQRVAELCDRVDPRKDLPEVDVLVRNVGDTVARALAPAPQLAWARLSPAELEASKDVSAADVREGLVLLSALADRGLPIPPGPAAMAAEVLQRAGDLPAARQAVKLAVQGLDRSGPDATAAGAVGRVLNRMGDPDRARWFLELACAHGDATDDAARADDLAWLSRCILDRIDRLRARKRHRAVMELIATFLARQAPRLQLAKLDPGDDEPLMWSVYYINLRLGRVMALAAEMANTAGDVYAKQAVDLLTRAVELAPFKPDAYKFLRPLLTDRRSGASDPRRWMSLVASAPPQVQRRLGGR